MEDLVSIIIPTYNRANLIEETLDSIIRQTHQNWECIVVDDGSEDHTDKIILKYREKDKRFHFYKRPLNRSKGGNAARNFGFKKSRGAYIKWFDSDDLMDHDLIESQLNDLIKKNKKISVCLFDRYSSDFSNIEIKAKPNCIKLNAYYDFVTTKIKINLPTVLWHRTVIEPFELDESLTKSQEYDFIQKVLKNNYKEVLLLNMSLVRVRNHADSITGNYFLQDTKKVKSSMEVKLRVLNDITSDTPILVKTDLVKLYFKALFKVFKFKKTKLLYYYLFKIYGLKELQIKFMVIKVGILYFIYFFTGKGAVYYNKILSNE
ncbi:glycosyltransferase family 2 protein [Algibacter mikhailovii]|uniref:Glycosyltransferase 2-like domain-containing protein n=1 Tax=Algibacter mikhailovii TaxID=425498 RepID=A0A918QZB5_9FLAO|nr:glycosyltransferase family 2 protein [Algibacter mikhailovii]GGZ81060.1 hypothetical protein GCM10007028_18110 [Algibacter mikhailovii]